MLARISRLGVADSVDARYKFGGTRDEDRRCEYQDVFSVEKTSGWERLVIAPSAFAPEEKSTLSTYALAVTRGCRILNAAANPFTFVPIAGAKMASLFQLKGTTASQ
jgi:hypothetical protein